MCTPALVVPQWVPVGRDAIRIATFREIMEDGVTQEATVILQAGEGYNVVNPATATIRLKDF
jgi:hypothetical protein